MRQAEGSAPLSKKPVIIIGGGVSGLTLAYRLHQAGVHFELFERQGRFGGNITKEEFDGYIFDVGPDSFLKTKPETIELCKELGLSDQLIETRPEGRRVFIGRGDQLFPLPDGLNLGIPQRAAGLLGSPLLTTKGKWRALLEPFIKPKKTEEEESFQSFFSRRLGVEMAQTITAPLLSGVYAGDATTLSLDVAFPQLRKWERESGSLLRGSFGGLSRWAAFLKLFFTKAPVKGQRPSPFMSLRGGITSMIEALVQALPEECLHLNARAEVVSPAGDPLVVRVHSLEKEGRASSLYSGRHVVIAQAPWDAAKSLGSLNPKVRAVLEEVRGFSTSTVYFAFDEKDLLRPLDGSGFIIPAGQGKALACTWVSSKWPGRAPKGKALMRLFFGGTRLKIDGLRDEQLIAYGREELARLSIAEAEPEWSRVYRYENGTPQPELGHQRRVEVFNAAHQEQQDFTLLGAGYGGVGIADCIRRANQLSHRGID